MYWLGFIWLLSVMMVVCNGCIRVSCCIFFWRIWNRVSVMVIILRMCGMWLCCKFFFVVFCVFCEDVKKFVFDCWLGWVLVVLYVVLVVCSWCVCGFSGLMGSWILFFCVCWLMVSVVWLFCVLCRIVWCLDYRYVGCWIVNVFSCWMSGMWLVLVVVCWCWLCWFGCCCWNSV